LLALVDVVLVAAAAAAMVRPRLEVADWGELAESLTLMLNVDFPLAVGVPLILPAVESVRPAGSEPEARLQVYGVVPPVAAKVAE
jgi:hypothetical protein